MISAGQTKVTDIKVGRQVLCKEKPNTRATSACAKQLVKTVMAAKRGLTTKQQKLWQKYVYTTALLQVQRFCTTYRPIRPINPFSDDDPPPRSKGADYKVCANRILKGSIKFKDLFGKKHKWSDFLINGAKTIKKLPTTSSAPPRFDGSTNPNKLD